MNIAFRADASLLIGSGHIMRCLTLAEAVKKRGGTTRFVCRHIPDGIRALITQKGHELVLLNQTPVGPGVDDLEHSSWLGTSQIHDADQTVQALGGEMWDWVVVDHYALDNRWESSVRRSARNIMAIDDLANRQHDCDALLDQNLYIDGATRYDGKAPSRCKMLLGPRYALLREEFQVLHLQASPRNGPVKRILVFFGGMDAANFTGKTIQVLSRLKNQDFAVDVVIGAQHPHRAEIEAASAANGYACHVQTEHMATLMAAADLAIGAGGSASWERCALGLPALTISAAANQEQLIHDAAVAGLLYAPLVQQDLAEVLELHIEALMDNPLLRFAMSRKCLDLVDGRGVSRILSHLGCADLELQYAGNDDMQNLFEWRNHFSIREVSRDTAPITWENHQRWFRSVLADENRILLIGMRSAQPVGVIRFDIRDEKAEISIYVVPGKREPGLGSELLLRSERWLLEHRPDVREITATVLGENWPSHRLFSNNGYRLESTCYRKEMVSL